MQPTTPTDTLVSEIVTFRLTGHAEVSAFLAAADQMQRLLKATGAMVQRTLSESDTGTWTDHIVWTSLAAAQTAAAELPQKPEAQPFMSLIDPGSVTMQHAKVHLQQG